MIELPTFFIYYYKNVVFVYQWCTWLFFLKCYLFLFSPLTLSLFILTFVEFFFKQRTKSHLFSPDGFYVRRMSVGHILNVCFWLSTSIPVIYEYECVCVRMLVFLCTILLQIFSLLNPVPCCSWNLFDRRKKKSYASNDLSFRCCFNLFCKPVTKILILSWETYCTTNYVIKLLYNQSQIYTVFSR